VYRPGRDGRPLATYVVPDDWRPENAPLRLPLGTAPDGEPVAVRHRSGAPAAVGEVAEIGAGADRTGDLGRRLADGTLEYVGPAGQDPQTDRAETTACLRDAPDVWDAVVTEHVDAAGRATVVGHLASNDAALDTAPIRPRLVTLLPPDLVPDDIVVHGRLPLTLGGEYDLDALVDGLDGGDRTDTYVAPRTPMETRLTEILEELLGTPRIGVHDSFFELGGFSLLATRLTSRVRETFQVEISLRNVFEAQTVDGLAQLIVRAQAERSGAGALEALLDEIEPRAAGRG
jgi:acyl carrier protein